MNKALDKNADDLDNNSASEQASDSTDITTKDDESSAEKTPNNRSTLFEKARLLAYAGLTITPLFWAGNFLLSRMASYDLTPMAISFWRWLFAFAIILPIGYQQIMEQRAEIKAQIKPLILLSALGIAAYNSFLYIAAHSTTAINMTLFAAALPIVTILLAWRILGAAPSRCQITGVVFAVIGFLTIMTRGSLAAFGDLGLNPGDLLMLLATVCWALYSVLYRKWQITLKPLALLTVLFGLGAVMVFPFYLFSLWNQGGFYFETHITSMLVYLAIFPSILAFLFWNKGLQVLGPSITAIFMYLVPVFTALLSIPLLGESLQSFHLLGGGLIMLGVFIATLINDRYSQWFNNSEEAEAASASALDQKVRAITQSRYVSYASGISSAAAHVVGHKLRDGASAVTDAERRQEISNRWKPRLTKSYQTVVALIKTTISTLLSFLRSIAKLISSLLVFLANGLNKLASQG